MNKLNVAIIGQGRSGSGIHGKFLLTEENTKFNVIAVVDALPERRESAHEKFGCETFACYTELFPLKEKIDLVVNASFSHQHFKITLDLIEHGFNVLVEKPFSRTYEECITLCNAAEKKGVKLFVFHQTLVTPSYLKIKEIVKNGILGNIAHMTFAYSGFSHRWDWQTLQACVGGSLYNSGPHPLGHAFDLLDWDERTEVAYSEMKAINTYGDAEDFVHLILRAPEKPSVELDISCCDAQSGFVYKIQGSLGTLCASHTHYKLIYISPDEFEPKEVTALPLSDENGNPAYCSEKLIRHEKEEDITGSSFDTAVKTYYDSVYSTLTESAPYLIPPRKAALVIKAIEKCHADNPMPIIYNEKGEKI